MKPLPWREGERESAMSAGACHQITACNLHFPSLRSMPLSYQRELTATSSLERCGTASIWAINAGWRHLSCVPESRCIHLHCSWLWKTRHSPRIHTHTHTPSCTQCSLLLNQPSETNGFAWSLPRPLFSTLRPWYLYSQAPSFGFISWIMCRINGLPWSTTSLSAFKHSMSLMKIY